MPGAEKPVLIGVDASPAAVEAARAGQAVADVTGAPIRLVHATPDAWSVPAVADSISPDVEALNDAARHAARLAVAHELGNTVSAGALDAMDIMTGRAAVVLRECAERIDAGLVVLGGKHHSVLGRWVVGSTAHALVRSLETPLLVTTPEMLPVARVMAAVDLSDAGGPTIKAASRFAELFGASLHVLHVVAPLPIIPETPLRFTDQEVGAHAQAHLERYVWPEIDFPGATTSIARGPVTTTIAQEAIDRQVDVLVVGSHGKGWVDRLLIGSVTERLLNALPCTVLVVPVMSAASRRRRTGERRVDPNA
ncbi:MAG TPA: universal stress protein [Gemmatimonadales bacterium]